MNRYRKCFLVVLAATAVAILAAAPVSAHLITIQAHDELLGQDSLGLGTEVTVDELGWGADLGGPFPVGQRLTSSTEGSPYTPCSKPGNFDDPAIPNIAVTITNQTQYDFTDVWYVADEGTTLSNFDGTVAPFGPAVVDLSNAFKIDSVGFNKPLIGEDITVNDIWESGETWQFVIQDYSGPGAADLFNSLGVLSGGVSTGSIIAVPEPSTTALCWLAGGIGAFGVWRRRKRSQQSD